MSRRRTTAVVAGVLTAGAVAAAVTVFNLPDAQSSDNGASDVPANTAEIAKETLVDRESHDGTLGHGDTTKIAAKGSGTITWLPSAGSAITRGKALYRLDNKPVTLLYGTLPAYRTLKPGIEGSDVLQFERNLWALGYRGFTVDDEYTSATADAVEDWQDDVGLTETGRVETSQIVYASGAIRVDSLSVQNGAGVQPGGDLLEYTGTSLVAAVVLDTDSQRLARRGAAVQVEMPDGNKVDGKITEVVTTVEQGEGDRPDTTVLDVTIGFTGKAPTGYDQASVTAYFIASERSDVLTVPVAALLALAEGGYGVQVVEGAATRIVAVKAGLFADGKVEISGSGLQPGMRVGVPA